jgi:hypothetical protein
LVHHIGKEKGSKLPIKSKRMKTMTITQPTIVHVMVLGEVMLNYMVRDGNG